MKRRKSTKKRKQNRKIVGIVSFVFLTIVVMLSISAHKVYSKVDKWNNLIYPKIKIENIDVGGKTKEEAKKLLEKNISNVVQDKKIDVKVKENSYSIKLSSLNPTYDIEKVVNEAFNYGKNASFYEKYKSIKNPVSKEYEMKLKYDKDPIEKFILSIKEKVNKSPVDAKITKKGENFIVSKGAEGIELNEKKLKTDLISSIEKGQNAETNIEALTNAVKPKITEETLKKIDTKIASYSTNYGKISSSSRAHNIQLATKTINGTLLMPQDTFSFNGKLGKRTPEKGYQKAGVLIGNTAGTDYGGGICQVSTTMYNAILMSNINSVSRWHHTEPSHYGQIGLDATVDYASGTDYKFKNTLEYPIYIEGYTSNGIIGFNVYSNSELTKREYKLRSETYETVQPKVIYKNDSTMEEGKTKVQTKGKVGYKVKSYRDTYENGKLIKNELISNDYYKVVNKVVLKGTKK